MSKITYIQIKDLPEQKRAKIEAHLSLWRSNIAQIRREKDRLIDAMIENGVYCIKKQLNIELTKEEFQDEINKVNIK